MNSVVLSGNLGADPEVRYSSDGDPIASFNLAVKSGREKTAWIKVVAFKRLAEVVETYLHRGARVLVSGCLDQDKWETDEGQKRTLIKVLANSIEFLKTDGRGFDHKTNSTDTPTDDDDHDDPPF